MKSEHKENTSQGKSLAVPWIRRPSNPDFKQMYEKEPIWKGEDFGYLRILHRLISVHILSLQFLEYVPQKNPLFGFICTSFAARSASPHNSNGSCGTTGVKPFIVMRVAAGRAWLVGTDSTNLVIKQQTSGPTQLVTRHRKCGTEQIIRKSAVTKRQAELGLKQQRYVVIPRSFVHVFRVLWQYQHQAPKPWCRTLLENEICPQSRNYTYFMGHACSFPCSQEPTTFSCPTPDDLFLQDPHLGSFAKLRKATLSFVMSVRPSVCMKQLVSF